MLTLIVCVGTVKSWWGVQAAWSQTFRGMRCTWEQREGKGSGTGSEASKQGGGE